jgi:hypothetical protein
MEGSSVDIILSNVKKENYHGLPISFNTYIHDKDSCTSNLFSEHFPSSIEKNDPNHILKNLKKKVPNNFKNCINKAFNYSKSKCENNPDKFGEILLNFVDHWTGDHSKCDSNCKGSTVQLPKKSNQYIILRTLFEQVAKDAEKFVTKGSTQQNESFHHKKFKYYPKDLVKKIKKKK